MWAAFVAQEEEGCDYSIACGVDLWMLNATTREEATEELRVRIVGAFSDKFGEHEFGQWEPMIEKACLLNISSRALMPVGKWYEQAEAQKQAWKAAITEEAEREQYRKLKEKFEGRE